MSTTSTKQALLETDIEEHMTFLRGRLLGLGVDDSALDDAVQDVLEVLVRRLDAYDDQRSFRRWMAGVARKVARRHRDRHRRTPLTLADDVRATLASDPERTAMTDEAWARLDAFLSRLHPDQWAVFVLSEMEGLRGTEIAAELGVNLSTVYARLRSARKAFNAAVADQRGRWLPAWLPGLGASTQPARPSLALVSTSMLIGLSGIGLVTMLGSTHCVNDEAPAVAELGSTPSEIASAAPGSDGVAVRPSDPAGLAGTELDDTPIEPAPDPDGWIEAGSGMSTNPDGILSREQHYRLEGDTVVYRLTLIGDDDVAMTTRFFEADLDGMQMVDAPPREPVTIPAGETREVFFRLRATRPGRVRFKVPMGSDTVKAYASHVLMFEDGHLRKCGDTECTVVLDSIEEHVSGEMITVHLINDCAKDVNYILAPGFDAQPPPGTPVHTIEAGARRTIEIDSAMAFRHVDERGRASSGMSSDEDGARIHFTGSGDPMCGFHALSPGLDLDDLPSVP